MVGEDDVPRLLTTQRIAARSQCFEDVAVADARLDHVDPGVAHRQVETEIGHHRHDDGVVAKLTLGEQIRSDDGDDVIAVDDRPGVIDGDQAVCVTVECHADVGAVLQHRSSNVRRHGRATSIVDVAPIRCIRDHDHLRAGGAEHLRPDHGCSTIRCVEHDAQPVEAAPLEVPQHMVDIGSMVAVVRHRSCVREITTAQDRLQLGLDALLDVVGQLEPAEREQLDPIVVIRVVGGRHDRSERTQALRFERDHRSGSNPERHHLDALGTEPVGKCMCEQFGRLACIATDHHAAISVRRRQHT